MSNKLYLYDLWDYSYVCSPWLLYIYVILCVYNFH